MKDLRAQLLPLKGKRAIPLCPPATVRIKGIGEGKETQNFSIIGSSRNRLQVTNLSFPFQGELVVLGKKVKFQDRVAV